MSNETKAQIIIDSFIKNNGHYRKMSQELTIKYGSGYSIATISNYINSPYLNICATKEQLEMIRKILIANSNNLGDNLDKTDNPYYQKSKKEKIEQIINCYLNGSTMEQIATELKISKQTVSIVITEYLKENPLLLKKYGKEIEKTKINNKKNNDCSTPKVEVDNIQVIELYLQGKTMGQIAEMAKVSISKISRILKSV